MIIRSLLGVQIVAQSWTLQQEEPIDYAVYAAQQAALQVCHASVYRENSQPPYRMPNYRKFSFA